jgi:KilA-N domain
MSKTLSVPGGKVTVITQANEDYICLTDMVKSFKGADQLIKNWMQTKNTIEYLGVWEELNNPDFNLVEFHLIRNEAGSNKFLLSVKQWLGKTNAVGMMARAGRYGGTYAHKDIALEFASWLSPAFKLYIVKEFQRLKADEERQNDPQWAINRTLAKINFRLQTDAVKRRLIPPSLPKKDIGFIYANEADLVNVALTGSTAKEWRTNNQDKTGNLRDHLSVE